MEDEEIMIDISDCKIKHNDDCLAKPIYNEYDIVGYNSCKAQTLCPYRTRKIIYFLRQENARLREENFNFEEIVKLCRCEQYRQTLQEIKEITERNIEIADTEGLSGCYRRGLAKQILQKISEV